MLFFINPDSRANEDEIVECSLDTQGRYGRTSKKNRCNVHGQEAGASVDPGPSQKWIPSVSAGAVKIGSPGINGTDTNTKLTNIYQPLLSCRRDNGQ